MSKNIKNLIEEQLKALINNTLNKFAYVFSSASKHISQLEEYRKKASLSGTRIDEVDQMLDYAKPKLKKLLVIFKILLVMYMEWMLKY